MKVIDAFAGLGGFSLAADALGWDTVAFVEWDKDCQFWLSEHWPNVPIYGDITTVRWEDAPRCDIFTAGFPCQPHSVAGKRAASDDSRDLWSECVRAISTLRPRYAVLENVPGLLTSESGRFFNRVLSDLAKIGYVGRYDVLSAAECGAPHRRERVWIVAWPMDDAHRGRRKQRHASIRCDDVVEPRHDSVGDAELSEGSRLRQLGGNGAATPDRHGQASSMVRRFALPDWVDAIPYRGADGTVRLIPAGAVEEEISRPEPALRALADGLPDNVARRPAAEEVTQWATPRAGEAKQGPSSTEKHRLSGKDWMLSDEASDFTGKPAAEEAEAWPTPRSCSAMGAEFTDEAITKAGDRFPNLESVVQTFTPRRGGSLWPVTDSAPGRVARLKAVGNAVVPAWVLAGPFQYILDREGLRDNKPLV